MPKTDKTLQSAVDVAREAVLKIARADQVGEHAGFVMDADLLGTHVFACVDPGYVGWNWVATVARVPRSKNVTICEVDLVPGDGALLAPQWVPWEDRLRPGDYSRSDVQPYVAHDVRLDQAHEDVSDNPDLVELPELGLGRPRVLSAEGLQQAANRWYKSEQGPLDGRRSGSTCSSCGFLLKMSGSMRSLFGVCANEWAPDDGRVVSLDHSCGAHSETDVPKQSSEWVVRPNHLDDYSVESQVIEKESSEQDERD